MRVLTFREYVRGCTVSWLFPTRLVGGEVSRRGAADSLPVAQTAALHHGQSLRFPARVLFFEVLRARHVSGHQTNRLRVGLNLPYNAAAWDVAARHVTQPVQTATIATIHSGCGIDNFL